MKVFDNLKKKWKKRADLNRIKENAYNEEMKKQAIWMGQEKAKLESQHRREIYAEKLKKIRTEFKKPKTQLDSFGIGKSKGNYNWITGVTEK